MIIVILIIVSIVAVMSFYCEKCNKCGKIVIAKKLQHGMCEKCCQIEEKEKRHQKEREEQERRERELEAEVNRKRLEENRQILEMERRIAEENRKKRLAQLSENFENGLSAIPCHDIKLDSEYVPEEFEIKEYKFTSLRSNMDTVKVGDFVVVDVETTGLSYHNEKIVEVSAIKFNCYEPVEIFSTLINPEKKIPKKAIEIHHITDEMVKDAPVFQSVLPDLENFMGKYNLVGHNLEFDLNFLEEGGYNHTKHKRKYYDTLKIARSVIDRDYVENYKLQSCCEYYDIYNTESHRSKSDAYATALLFIELLKEKMEVCNIEQLINFK